MALLELAPAATGTGIVAASVGEATLQFLLLLREEVHNISGRSLSTQFCRHSLHWQINMGEESFVSLAQVVQAGLAVWRIQDTVLGTASVTDKAYRAFPTVAWKRIAFGLPELVLLLRIHHSQERSLLQVSKFVVRFDKVVTGIYISVVLHCERRAACFLKNA